jgi:hypothetical protein
MTPSRAPHAENSQEHDDAAERRRLAVDERRHDEPLYKGLSGAARAIALIAAALALIAVAAAVCVLLLPV